MPMTGIVERYARDRACASGARWSRDCLRRRRASRPSISTTRWAARCSARSASCPSITRRAPSARSSASTARRSPTPSARGKQFVDLGAGDCCKALGLAAVPRAGALPRRRHRRATRSPRSLARMAPEFPEIEMLGVVADFTRGPRPAPRSRRAIRSRSSIRARRSATSRRPRRASSCVRCTCIASGARQRPADRRRHQEGSAAALDGVRRCGRRHRGVQPQRAASRQPRCSAATSSPRRSTTWRLRRGGGAHRDAPRRRARRRRCTLDGADAHLRGRRAHPHRELVQVRAGGVRRCCCSDAGFRTRALLAGCERDFAVFYAA